MYLLSFNKKKNLGATFDPHGSSRDNKQLCSFTRDAELKHNNKAAKIRVQLFLNVNGTLCERKHQLIFSFTNLKTF